MEETLVEQKTHTQSKDTPSINPPAIHRKPLPVYMATPNTEKSCSPPTTISVQEKDAEAQVQLDNVDSSTYPIYPYEKKQSYRPFRNTPPSRRRWHLQTKWQNLRKRTRYLILGGILAILTFIIGLAAGLSDRSNKFKNLPLPDSHGGPYTGDLTYYDPGLGACGITSSSKDFIIAVSHFVFDAVQKGSNPNSNPLCGKKIRANRNGRSVDLTVVDRCTGCQPKDIDVTSTVFEGLASIDQGRVSVTWAWLEDVPGEVTQS